MAVIPLPAALAPWSSGLDLFPKDVALALGRMLPRLSWVMAPGAPAPAEGGEPDGYDGIARKGSYERLLTTEWLLLSEIPDEFLRRVASGEHAFLHVAKRAREAARHAVILFDSGPDQLGAPRLVHVAALIVLAARLARQRGTLSWGVLQDGACTLQCGVTKASLRDLLSSASPRPATEGDVRAWLGVPEVREAPEVWLAAAEDLRPARSPATISMLRVSEVLEVGPSRLHVSAQHPSSPRPREAVLEAPAPELGVRVWRDGLGVPVPRRPAPAGVDPAAGLVVSCDGHWLYLRGTKGELFSQRIPGSPSAPFPSHCVYRPPDGHYIVAAGVLRGRRRTAVVCAGEGSYHVFALSKAGKWSVPAEGLPFDVPFEEGSRAAPVPGAPLRPLHFLNGGGVWFGEVGGEPGRPARELPDGRLTFGDGESGPVVLRPGQPAIVELNPSSLPMHRNDKVLLWARAALKVPPGAEFVAAASLGPPHNETRAVTMDASRRRVELATEHRSELLFTTSSPITAISVGSDLPVIGYMTAAGEVGAYSVRERATLMRLALQGGGALRRAS